MAAHLHGLSRACETTGLGCRQAAGVAQGALHPDIALGLSSACSTTLVRRCRRNARMQAGATLGVSVSRAGAGYAAAPLLPAASAGLQRVGLPAVGRGGFPAG